MCMCVCACVCVCVSVCECVCVCVHVCECVCACVCVYIHGLSSLHVHYQECTMMTKVSKLGCLRKNTVHDQAFTVFSHVLLCTADTPVQFNSHYWCVKQEMLFIIV